MKRIVITGATSGIGRGLALAYAGPDVVLGLVGRRAGRLGEVAAACVDQGARVLEFAVSVRDQVAMREVARGFTEFAGGADLVVANAGSIVDDNLSAGDPKPITDLLETNVVGLVNTLLPFVPIMSGQRSGHLVAIGSAGGFRAVPRHAGYAASKAAVRFLMDGFGYDLNELGIHTTVINPGFVESEMSEGHDFRMPFLMDTHTAVGHITRAIERRKRSHTFPWQTLPMLWVLPLLPRVLVKRFLDTRRW